jgi:hypothetical protein
MRQVRKEERRQETQELQRELAVRAGSGVKVRQRPLRAPHLFAPDSTGRWAPWLVSVTVDHPLLVV